jgi:hypothetical protein
VDEELGGEGDGGSGTDEVAVEGGVDGAARIGVEVGVAVAVDSAGNSVVEDGVEEGVLDGIAGVEETTSGAVAVVVLVSGGGSVSSVEVGVATGAVADADAGVSSAVPDGVLVAGATASVLVGSVAGGGSSACARKLTKASRRSRIERPRLCVLDAAAAGGGSGGVVASGGDSTSVVPVASVEVGTSSSPVGAAGAAVVGDDEASAAAFVLVATAVPGSGVPSVVAVVLETVPVAYSAGAAGISMPSVVPVAASVLVARASACSSSGMFSSGTSSGPGSSSVTAGGVVLAGSA